MALITGSSDPGFSRRTVDHLGRLGEVTALARRTRRIAMQSVLAGMGLSLAAMGVATAGLLPAVWGALLQEGIDVAAILNAGCTPSCGCTPCRRTRPTSRSATTQTPCPADRRMAALATRDRRHRRRRRLRRPAI